MTRPAPGPAGLPGAPGAPAGAPQPLLAKLDTYMIGFWLVAKLDTYMIDFWLQRPVAVAE
jgi:hypothetical protein